MPVRLILTGHGYKIGRRGGMIVIKRMDGGRKEVSVGNLSAIIVSSRGVSITGDAASLLLRHGVQVVFISGNRPIGRLQPMRLRPPVALKKEQVKAQLDERGATIAREIVLNKVDNQIKLLKWLVRSRVRSNSGRIVTGFLEEAIKAIAEVREELVSTPLNMVSRAWLISKEAEAARYYWGAVARVLPEELGFEERKARYDNPTDPFNLSLNYLYSLLASELWFSVEMSGLDPYIGFLHEDNNRRPSLVMDLMEEFRQPVVDKLLIGFFSRRRPAVSELVDEDARLREDFRKELLKLFYGELDRTVTFMNRAIPIRGHIHLQPRRLARYILGLSPSYRPFNVI